MSVDTNKRMPVAPKPLTKLSDKGVSDIGQSDLKPLPYLLTDKEWDASNRALDDQRRFKPGFTPTKRTGQRPSRYRDATTSRKVSR